ncbi:hypothetical protein WKV53_07795 [Luteolibacter sp. Y139]|uniref:DUF2721 domain-containing protein n=2 Tax=Luteolibacter soli TaxID=3135280 RepID=A0ABU9AS44_9BACT
MAAFLDQLFSPVVWVLTLVGSILLSVFANLISPWAQRQLSLVSASYRERQKLKKQKYEDRLDVYSSSACFVIKEQINVACILLIMMGFVCFTMTSLGTLLILREAPPKPDTKAWVLKLGEFSIPVVITNSAIILFWMNRRFMRALKFAHGVLHRFGSKTFTAEQKDRLNYSLTEEEN